MAKKKKKKNKEKEVEEQTQQEAPQEITEEEVSFKNCNPDEIECALEALIFAAPEAPSLKRLKKLLEAENFEVENLKDHIKSLQQKYETRGFQLMQVGQSYQFRTHPEQAKRVQKLTEEKAARLSKSALEVLAIIAYKQPVTRADMDHIRGIDSGHLMKGLMEKNLVRTLGHKEAPGRPLLYGTTPYFLDVFSLSSLDDLPSIEEFNRELDADDVPSAEEAALLEADPGFESPLAAEPDRGFFDEKADEEVQLPDFSSADPDEQGSELDKEDPEGLDMSAQ